MKIWEDEKQCYIRAAMEKNSEAENEALKAQLDAIDWSVLEQIERTIPPSSSSTGAGQ